MSEASEVGLLACPNPWCEAEERVGDYTPQVRLGHHGNYRVVCTSCILEGPCRPTKEDAIAAWNTRTHPPLSAPDELCGRLAELLALAEGPRDEKGYWLDHVLERNLAQIKLKCYWEYLPLLLADRTAIMARIEEVEAQHTELLFAVSMKHPGETRHETALRYIRQAESGSNNAKALLASKEDGA